MIAEQFAKEVAAVFEGRELKSVVANGDSIVMELRSKQAILDFHSGDLVFNDLPKPNGVGAAKYRSWGKADVLFAEHVSSVVLSWAKQVKHWSPEQWAAKAQADAEAKPVKIESIPREAKAFLSMAR